MRKILSREEKDKKIKRNQIVIGIVLIGILIFGTIGYAFRNEENNNLDKIEYKNIEFIKENEYWNFNIQGYSFITKYNPEEIQNISFFSSLSINDYINKPLYLVSNYEEPNFEISRNLNSFVLRMQKACLEDCAGDFPIKNCSEDNIIIIKEPEKENEKIYQEENCIFIIADLENQTKYADVVLFKILGID